MELKSISGGRVDGGPESLDEGQLSGASVSVVSLFFAALTLVVSLPSGTAFDDALALAVSWFFAAAALVVSLPNGIRSQAGRSSRMDAV